MARIIVEVMPRAEILDPQGQAVQAALARLGYDGVQSVRQGKRFEIEVVGELDEAARERFGAAAEGLLANPVIESWTLHTED